MKLDFDTSFLSRFFGRIVSEFGQKRLWPVAAVLLAGIVAVPVLLSNSSSTPSATQPPLPSVGPSGTSLPTINVQSTPTSSHLTGPAHDPFAGGTSVNGATSSTGITSGSGLTGTTSGSAITSGSSTGTSTGSPGASTGSASSSTTSSGSSGTGTPPSITGNSKPKPAPSGLRSTQSYDVAMAITNSSGGVNTLDPMPRLNPIPNNQQPLLVELGVLKGGNHVLFAVQPGTVISGPGTCTPGPIDCEILSLGQDQTESVASHDGSESALFAITGITAVTDSSKAAADKAREAASAAGMGVLDSDSSSLPVLSLFRYEPSVGSVVDLRNLTVGG